MKENQTWIIVIGLLILGSALGAYLNSISPMFIVIGAGVILLALIEIGIDQVRAFKESKDK